MDRLVDYFAVVGHDFDKTDFPGKGKVLTRIPEQDWDGEPFIQGIELFCQPSGWYLAKERQPPKYFVCVLTDAYGKRHYCAVMSFSERRDDETPSLSNGLSPGSGDKKDLSPSQSPTQANAAEDFVVDESMCQVEVNHESSSEINNINGRNSKSANVEEFSTKCLVLISRQQEFDVLKNCLNLIYTIYIEDLSVSLETVIANLLAVNVPPRGTSIYRFSIGAADKQALQRPQYEELPVTRSSAAMLLRQLGILNVMNVLCAALVDHKLLFYSCSFTRLTESCNALTALMFPFSYSYPYIPILPHDLLECTASPTPFLIGVHSSFKSELHDLVDVITVDLDGGVISVPDCISVPGVPEPYYTMAVELLTKVLCPDLVMADYAYPPEQINTSEPEKLDKEIRAIFLRLFCQLLMGYRSCLQVCRIHPHPVIRFQKDPFLIARGYKSPDSGLSPDFMSKLVESQAFSLFIQEEGLPYRRLTIFDRVLSGMHEQLQKEGGDINKSLRHVKDIAYDLYRNEHPSAIHPTQKVPKPSESAHSRPKQVRFPKLSPTAVQTFMADRVKKLKNEFENSKPIERRSMRVPDGTSLSIFATKPNVLATSSRRLQVLRNCVQFIFESRTLETKKIFHAVLRALKSSFAREALAQELNAYAVMKPQLDNQQFDYIARLCNCALEDSSGGSDEYILPAKMLPAFTSFYRKLCPTVMQFLYTVVQDHDVWSLVEFWEFTFFADIEDEMCRLYRSKKNRTVVMLKDDTKDVVVSSPKFRSPISPTSIRRSSSTGNIGTDHASAQKEMQAKNDLSGLEIASTELRDLLIKSDKEKQELALAEEGVIVGQIQHVSQRMLFMLVPMDASTAASYIKFLRNAGAINEDSSNSYFTSSLAGSVTGSIDDDDALGGDAVDVTGAVTKFVSMFVDKTCSETGISADFSKSLLSKVPNLVLMQHESLHDVYKESKRLPPIKKAKLLEPKLLPGEFRYEEHIIRGYLSADGRSHTSGETQGGPALLPAEGAVFVTNYRLIFIGIPCDPLASDQVVIRSFPVSSLFKVKHFVESERLPSKYVETTVQHWILLYSSTFQLLVIGFDEEDTTEEQRAAFEQFMHSLRNPTTIEGVFAIQAGSPAKSPIRPKAGEKDGGASYVKKAHNDKTKTPAKYGAKTLVKQAKKKAGMTLGKQSRFSRLVMPDSKTKTLYFTPASHENYSGNMNSAEAMDRSPMDETLTKTLTDRGTIDRLFRRACQQDFTRVKLVGQPHCQFRLTNVNRMFSVCRSYPVCAVVPKAISDENVRSLSHCHHQSRFPCLTWMHPTNMAVLCRSGSLKARTATSLFKHGHSAQSLSDDGTAGSAAEEERFLLAVIEAVDTLCPNKTSNRDSSLFKLLPSDAKPTMARGNNGYASSFREARLETSSSKTTRRWGTLSRATGKPEFDHLTMNNRDGTRLSDRPASAMFRLPSTATIPGINFNLTEKTKLYVFVEKSQAKGLRQEQQGRIQFVSVDLPEPKQVRSGFKSLLKGIIPVHAPVVSDSSAQSLDEMLLYRKAVEESGWLQQVSVLLSVSGAIVDLIDIQGASVLIAVEDGWDSALQLSSLAQIMLDPYYRTVEGFRTLVQKEWLSFGHRFSHRNRFNETISSGFTPMFIQFLDCVYQILRQFPLAFEYNSMYLKTIAYHSVSNRFNTFVLDSDFERLEAGILFSAKNRSRVKSGDELSRKPSSPTKALRKRPGKVESLWEYIDLTHKRTSLFHNSLYSPPCSGMQVLRPVTNVSCLHIWPYYTQESLSDCPAFDGLLGELSTGTRPNEQETTEVNEAWGGQSGRRVVNFGYDGVSEVQPDIIRSLMQQIEQLQMELDEPVDSWHDLITSATRTVMQNKHLVPKPKQYAIEQMRLMHKKLTLDILKSTSKDDITAETVSLAGDVGTLRPVTDSDLDTASLYRFQPSSSETRTYESTLWKRGAYMKNWKQRFFVLDSTKHQLRQYESKLDKICKSVYDLKEVESVKLMDRISGAPKGVGDNSFFEVKTAKRSYHFIAESDEAAGKWVDVLQSALHG